MPGSEGGGASPGTVADAVVVAEAPRRWATNAAPDARGGPEVTLLVRLLDEGERATPAPGLDPARFIDWCRRNKFPLLSLERHTPAWLAEDPDFARALAAESDWFATQHGEYHRLRDAWLARGIPCLLIKSAGEHPAFPHSSDNIDILVHPEQGLAARETLRDLGYVELRNIEEPGKFLFRRFSDGVCVSAIHLHERIAWFVGFLDDQAVWRRARAAHDDPAVTIPASEDAVLINLAHACYENKELRLIELVRLRHALRAAGDSFDWAELERVALRRGWRDGLGFLLLVCAAAEEAFFGASLIPAPVLAHYAALARDDRAIWERLQEIRDTDPLELPLDLSYLFCKRLYYRKIFADPTRERSERWRDAAATLIWGFKLKSGLRPQPGFVVSLSGLDGSGKTAHARALIDAFRLSELRAEYRWSRGGSTGLLGLASRLRRRGRSTAPASSDAITRRRKRFERPGARLAWAWLVSLDQIASSYASALAAGLGGQVLVLDRCAYDAAVELDSSLPPDARWSRLAIGALLRGARRPGRAYLLDVSPETARARKPDEVWHAGLEEERRRYRQLARRQGQRVLSTEGPFASSNDPLLRETMTAFMARFETRRNALLYANPSQKNPVDPCWAGGGEP